MRLGLGLGGGGRLRWGLCRRDRRLEGWLGRGLSPGAGLLEEIADHWIRAMIPNLFDPIGFGWTMRTVAFMFLFLLVIALLTVRSRLDHKPSSFQAMDFVQPLKETPLVLLALASFFFFMGVFLPYNFLVVEARDNGMDPRLANYLLTVLSATRLVQAFLNSLMY